MSPNKKPNILKIITGLSAAIMILMLTLLCACDSSQMNESQTSKEINADMTEEQEAAVAVTYDMQLKIGDTPVSVTWEKNDAVDALADMTTGDWHDFQLSMYGGFEQVGSLGSSLPASDKQMTTEAGDIVLYSGNQIVVFYGSNSWSYTKLGHIDGMSQAELEKLLGNGDVTISIKTEFYE